VIQTLNSSQKIDYLIDRPRNRRWVEILPQIYTQKERKMEMEMEMEMYAKLCRF
jgi:hypothetical protein